MKTREEKLKLLKDLKAGRVTLADFMPKQFKILLHADSINYFVNGKEVSKDEFDMEHNKQRMDEASYTRSDSEVIETAEGLELHNIFRLSDAQFDMLLNHARKNKITQ